MLKRLLTVIAWTLCELSSVGAGAQQVWPRIKSFDRTFTFASRKEMFLRFPIKNNHGRVLYIVECASPFADDKRVSQYAYSRDFECRVALPGATLLPSIQLLALNSRIDKEWQSRGGFWWSELVPTCASYPDWGAKRIYRFRGIRLIIDISDVQMRSIINPTKHQPNFELQSMKVRILGERDQNAIKPFGGASLYPEPTPADPDRPYGYMSCSDTPSVHL